MPASQARTGSRHGGGPGAARERAAPLRHSAAYCRVENRTHAAQARLQTHVCAIEHLLTTNLRLCQNASHRTSLTAAADMKLRYAAMLYTRAKTLARQELDWQQNQVAGGGGRTRPKSSSTHSSQNMPTSEHAMELEDTMVPMTVISCRQREKPVVSMSTSSSSLRHAARTRCLYARCAGSQAARLLHSAADCLTASPACHFEAAQHSVQ